MWDCDTAPGSWTKFSPALPVTASNHAGPSGASAGGSTGGGGGGGPPHPRSTANRTATSPAAHRHRGEWNTAVLAGGANMRMLPPRAGADNGRGATGASTLVV